MPSNTPSSLKIDVPVRAGSSALFQAAWVVPDIDAAIRHWGALGIGPFLTFRNVQIEISHRGSASFPTVSFALGQAGPMQIELICQHDDIGSAYRDTYQQNEGGFHHVGRLVDDYDAAVAEYVDQGLEVAMSGDNGGVRYAYIDTRSQIGCMTEIVLPVPACTDLYAAVSAASEDWDGRDPCREMNLTSALGDAQS